MEPIEITLETALVNGQTEVTFTYEGIEYTATLAEPWVEEDATQVATEAVEAAEASLLEADLAEAQTLVTALDASDAKTLLQARIITLQSVIDGIVAAVNAAADAGNQVALYQLLSAKPFVNADVELIGTYTTDIDTSNAVATATDTIAEIQAIVDAANEAPVLAATIALVDEAVLAVADAVEDPDGLVDTTNFPTADATLTRVEFAQAAIDALPETISDAVIAGAATVVTATVKADLQSELDEVKVVVPVLEAANQIELLAALQNDAFARVNAELIADYESQLAVTDITIALIQTAIDTVNEAEADALIAALGTTPARADYDEALAFVNTYVKADVDPDTTKADYLTDLAEIEAIISVNEADTAAELTAALDKLEAADDAAPTSAPADDFDIATVNSDLMEEYYLADITEATATNKDTVAKIQGLITTANGQAMTDVLADVAAIDAETTEADVLAILESRVLDLTDVNAELVAEYKALIVSGVDVTSATNIQNNVIDAANATADEEARLEAVNTAAAVSEMKTALTNVAIAKADGYVEFTSVKKTEIAELVLEVRPDDGFADTDAVIAAIAAQDIARDALILAVNNAGPDGTATIAAMDTALDGLGYSAYDGLTDAEQIDVADAFLTAFPMDETPAQVNYTTITDIRADIDAAIEIVK